MAWELHRHAFPGVAASNVQDRQVVTIAAGSADKNVHPCATVNVRPLGVALASAARLEAVTVHDVGNYVKAVAAASFGAGAEIGVIGATKSLNAVVGASGAVVHSVGQSVNAAGAGEVFTLYVNPRQLSGLV